ncbi:MAG TPA: RecX family transcriptional regulator [Armatimonadota bacterium]|jgi:regulatory protein
MPRITALEPQEHDPERRSVFVDGQFALGVSLDTLVALGLRVGLEVTPQALEHAAHEEDVHKAKEAAYRLLSYRARSEDELRRRLLRLKLAEDVVEEALRRLAASGLVNDQSFAEQWVRSRQQGHPSGRALIRWELRRKGVSDETTEEALEPLDEESELASARELVAQRLRRTSERDPAVLRQRLSGTLQRRGFSWEIIRQALEDLGEDEEE